VVPTVLYPSCVLAITLGTYIESRQVQYFYFKILKFVYFISIELNSADKVLNPIFLKIS